MQFAWSSKGTEKYGAIRLRDVVQSHIEGQTCYVAESLFGADSMSDCQELMAESTLIQNYHS